MLGLTSRSSGRKHLSLKAVLAYCPPLIWGVRRISTRLKLFDVLGFKILTCDAESILRA
jgi:hypothetical protein